MASRRLAIASLLNDGAANAPSSSSAPPPVVPEPVVLAPHLRTNRSNQQLESNLTLAQQQLPPQIQDRRTYQQEHYSYRSEQPAQSSRPSSSRSSNSPHVPYRYPQPSAVSPTLSSGKALAVPERFTPPVPQIHPQNPQSYQRHPRPHSHSRSATDHLPTNPYPHPPQPTQSPSPSNPNASQFNLLLHIATEERRKLSDAQPTDPLPDSSSPPAHQSNRLHYGGSSDQSAYDTPTKPHEWQSLDRDAPSRQHAPYPHRNRSMSIHDQLLQQPQPHPHPQINRSSPHPVPALTEPSGRSSRLPAQNAERQIQKMEETRQKTEEQRRRHQMRLEEQKRLDGQREQQRQQQRIQKEQERMMMADRERQMHQESFVERSRVNNEVLSPPTRHHPPPPPAPPPQPQQGPSVRRPLSMDSLLHHPQAPPTHQHSHRQSMEAPTPPVKPRLPHFSTSPHPESIHPSRHPRRSDPGQPPMVMTASPPMQHPKSVSPSLSSRPTNLSSLVTSPTQQTVSPSLQAILSPSHTTIRLPPPLADPRPSKKARVSSEDSSSRLTFREEQTLNAIRSEQQRRAEEAAAAKAREEERSIQEMREQLRRERVREEQRDWEAQRDHRDRMHHMSMSAEAASASASASSGPRVEEQKTMFPSPISAGAANILVGSQGPQVIQLTPREDSSFVPPPIKPHRAPSPPVTPAVNRERASPLRVVKLEIVEPPPDTRHSKRSPPGSQEGRAKAARRVDSHMQQERREMLNAHSHGLVPPETRVDKEPPSMSVSEHTVRPTMEMEQGIGTSASTGAGAVVTGMRERERDESKERDRERDGSGGLGRTKQVAKDKKGLRTLSHLQSSSSSSDSYNLNLKLASLSPHSVIRSDVEKPVLTLPSLSPSSPSLPQSHHQSQPQYQSPAQSQVAYQAPSSPKESPVPKDRPRGDAHEWLLEHYSAQAPPPPPPSSLSLSTQVKTEGTSASHSPRVASPVATKTDAASPAAESGPSPPAGTISEDAVAALEQELEDILMEEPEPETEVETERVITKREHTSQPTGVDEAVADLVAETLEPASLEVETRKHSHSGYESKPKARMEVDVEDELLSLVGDRAQVSSAHGSPAPVHKEYRRTGSTSTSKAGDVGVGVESLHSSSGQGPRGTPDRDRGSMPPPAPKQAAIKTKEKTPKTNEDDNVKEESSSSAPNKKKSATKTKNAPTAPAKPRQKPGPKPKVKAVDGAPSASSSTSKAPKTIASKKATSASASARSRSTSAMPSGSVGPETETTDKDKEKENEPEDVPEEDDKLYCVCKTKYDEDRVMIACDRCDDWYHTQCVNMPDLEVDLVDQFICPPCIEQHPHLSLHTTYKKRCLFGLSHANPSSPDACHKPARGALSKYCSDECGYNCLQTRIAEWTKQGGKQEVLWENVKDAEKREGVVMRHNGVHVKPDPQDMENQPVRIRSEKSRATQEAERLRGLLDQVVLQREEIKRGMEVVIWRERLLELAAERSQQLGQCGWDQRLCFGDEEWTEYGEGVLESYEENDGEDASEGEWWCPGPIKCERHNGWQGVRHKDVLKEKENKEEALLKLTTRERELRKLIEDVVGQYRTKTLSSSKSPLAFSNNKLSNGHSNSSSKPKMNGDVKKGKKRKALP